MLAVLLLAGVFTIWRIRGHNSPPIAARGGEFFRNFPSLATPFSLQHDPRWKDQPIGGSGVGKEGQEYSIRDPLGDGKSLKPLSSYGSDIYGLRIAQAGRP